MTVIVLRPEPEASHTAADARALGLDAVVAPLFELRALPWDPPPAPDVDALLLTSANAVRFGGPALAPYRQLPVYAVGPRTAGAARDAGFTTVHAGSGSGRTALAAALAGGRHALHLTGRDVTDGLLDGVEPGRVTAVAVYAADPLPAPTLPPHGIALLHSKRAVLRFAELVERRADYTLVAISANVAAAAGDGWAGSHAADRPTTHDMLSLAAALCKGQR